MAAPQLRDMTDFNFANTMRGVTSDGTISISFGYEMVQIDNPGDADKNGRSEKRLVVYKAPKGDRLTAAKRYITEEEAMRRYPAEFAAFTEYGDVPDFGTPLAELPGVSQSQIALLSLYGIRTVEDLAELPEESISGTGLQGRAARKIAQAWLAKKEENAGDTAMAERLAALEMERESRDEAMQKMADQNRALAAQLEAMQKMMGGGHGQQAAPAMAQGGMDASGAIMVDSQEEFDEVTSDPFTEGPEDGGDIAPDDDPDPLAGGF